MRVEVERPDRAAPVAIPVCTGMDRSVRGTAAEVPSWPGGKLYYSMRHRTQLYLDEGQYRWLKQRAGEAGSIAAVVRELIDAERARVVDRAVDPLLSYLVDEAPGKGRHRTSVASLDADLYGS